MATSITVDENVKRDLAAFKPDAITWNDFLMALKDSVDAGKLENALERISATERDASIARARNRYLKVRAGADTLLSSSEARKRVRELRSGR